MRAVRFVPYADAASYVYAVVVWVVGSGLATTVAWANNTMAWLTEVTGAPLGTFWYVLIFLGFSLLSSLAVLLTSAGVYLWRGGASRAGQDLSRDDPANDEQRREDPAPITENVCREDASLEQHLYLGQVICSCDPAHEHLLGFNMFCFNGSTEEIDVLSVRGHIKAKETRNNESVIDFGKLKTPQVCGDTKSTHIRPFSEFRLLLWQSISGEMAARLADGVDIELMFDFEELDVQLCRSNDYSVRARLSLWDGAKFVKLADHSCTHRSVIVRVRSGAAEAG